MMTALTELLAAAAARHPHAVAVADKTAELTYTQLWSATGRTAFRLHAASLAGGTVLLALPPGTAWVTALLGAWRSHTAAVPLDLSHPPHRLASLTAASRATGAVTPVGRPPTWAQHLTALAPATGTSPEPDRPPAPPGSTPLACIWHTSGSTGAPKPVPVPHDAVAARATVMAQHFGITAADRVAQLTSLTFDAVLWEVLTTLTCGARLQIAAPEDRLPGPALPAFLSRQRITAFTTTPTVLATAPFTELPHLRRIVLGGEALHPRPLARWIARYDVANAYGPTETCVDAIVAPHVQPATCPAPIGLPLPGVRAWALDEDHQPVPDETPGELYLGGTGLATGYLGLPQETAGRFLRLALPNSQGTVTEQRVYRTGDRVHRQADGQYVFLGRVDDQLNIGGVRLEPAEVEASAVRLPGIRAAVLLASHHGDGHPQLILHAESDDPTLSAPLRRHLAAELPSTAVPALILVRPSLPRTPSGKLDRHALAQDVTLTAVRPATAGPEPVLPEDVTRWWREQTGTTAGHTRDFFLDGGDSLSALLLLQRINEQYGTDITLQSFYAAPTLQFLSTVLPASGSS